MKGVFKTTARGPNNTKVGVVTQIELPFVPAPGLMVQINAHENFWRVDDVLWRLDRPDEVEMIVSDPGGLWPVTLLLNQGWLEE